MTIYVIIALMKHLNLIRKWTCMSRLQYHRNEQLTVPYHFIQDLTHKSLKHILI